MNNVNNFLNKYVVYALYAVMFLSIIGNFRSCGVNKDVSKLKKEMSFKIDSLTNVVDSLNSNIYSKEDLDIRMSIEGYEISKRMLYDQNSVVRTVIRPDDRMHEYDLKIKQLREKIK